MAAFGYVLDCHEADAHDDAEFWSGLTPEERFELQYPQLWAEGCRPVVANDNRSEDDASGDKWRASVERLWPGSAEDAPEPKAHADAADDRVAPACEAPTSENFEAEAEAGHSLAFDPMPDPRDTPTPDGKHFWHMGLAIYYVRQGVKIMPLTTGGTPVVKGCYEQLIDSEEAARDYWTKYPYCLIGIPAGANNLVIVDTDSVDHSDASADGVAEFGSYTAKHGGIPETPQTITGTGGLHTFFKYASGIRFKNSVGSFLPANDVRACNGYVVAQGVVKPNGKRNTVAPGTIPFAEAFARGLVADLPQYLIDDLPKKDDGHHGDDYQDARHGGGEQPAPAMGGSRPSKSKPTHREIEYAKAVFDGVIKDLEATRSSRNNALNNAAIRLGHYVVSGHLTHGEVSNALYEASRVNGYLRKDGPTVVKNTIKSGLTAGMREDARPPKDRSRDGTANGKRKYASSKHESSGDMRQQQESSEPIASANHWLTLHKLALSKKVTLRRAGGEWLFSGYSFLDDDDDRKVIEFAAPMSPDECADHLASALPGLFPQDTVEAFKRGDYGGGRDDGAEYREAEQEPTRLKLDVVNAASLAGVRFQPREWLVENVIPHGTVTLFAGDGGVGKSLLAMQLAVAVATNGCWIGLKPSLGTVVYLSAEDEVRDIHGRLLDMIGDLNSLHNLDIVPLADLDATLAVPNKEGLMEPTAMFGAVEDVVIDKRPDLLVLDTQADFFGGDEIKKIQARGFIALLRRLAIQYNMTVLLLSHPSQSGMASGTGTSGNVAWNNSVRSRLYLERRFIRDGNRIIEEDGDARILSVKKANYAKGGDQIVLRWERGVFVREREDERDEGDIKKRAERVFMTLLLKYIRQKRAVSDKSGKNYAPSVFAGDDANEGITRQQFASAMNRLFDDEKIRVDVIGPPSRQSRNVVPNNSEHEDRQFDDDEGMSVDNEDAVPWRRPK